MLRPHSVPIFFPEALAGTTGSDDRVGRSFVLPVRTGHTRLPRQYRTARVLANEYRFGDLNYGKEELRAELASVFLMAERGVPHSPDSHAAYLDSWLKILREDKHEIFRAARDAHCAADLLLALELHKSLDQAMAHLTQTTPLPAARPEPSMEMEL